MIIKIEDAPAVKHITIDIDFDGNGEAKTTIVKDGSSVGIAGTGTTTSAPVKDKLLDLDEDFVMPEQEIVEKPEINIEQREVKVSQDMVDATF